MRIASVVSTPVLLLAAVACGGSTTTSSTCGPGTVLLDNQCVAASGGGGAGGDTGSAGAMNAGGLGGASVGAAGSVMAGGAGVGAVDAGNPALVDFCAGREVVATGSPGLLDDFEDQDAMILKNDGRVSGWSANGAGCTFVPTPLVPQAPAAGATVNNASHYAMHVTVTGCTQSNLGAGFNGFGDGVNGGNCGYDASAYDGMYFWAMGANVRVNVEIGLRTTISEKYGGDGSCAQDATDKGCYDRHGVSIPLSADWKLYSFTWDQLHQAGWGTKTPFDTKLTTEIAFVATSNSAATPGVDYSVDNVGFFKGTPPSDPPIAGQ